MEKISTISKASLLASAFLCTMLSLGGAPSFAAAGAACVTKAADGSCLDDAPPTTGQYSTTQAPAGAVGLRASQEHGVVRVTESTYIFAHNICRFVDNPTTNGRGLFIGLESKTEWTSFIASPPVGANLSYCCQPATVSICGIAKTLPFLKSGQAQAFTGGYNYKATYTCGTGITGQAPTVDTSWAVVVSGQCAAPSESTGCKQNLHVSADCVSDDDDQETPGKHDGGSRGNHSGSNGDGPGNSGGSNDGGGD